MPDSGTACASLLPPPHFSRQIFLPRPVCRRVSVLICPLFVDLSSQQSLGLVPAILLSALHARALLPISSNRPSWLLLKASSSRPAGIPITATCPSNIRVCQYDHLILKSRVSHVTAPARSSHLSPCLYFKDLLPPRLLLQAWPWWKVLPQLASSSPP